MSNISINESSVELFTPMPIDPEWSIGQKCAVKLGYRALEQLLSMFYIMSPNATTYDDAHDVPNYEVALIPIIGLLLIIEQIIRFFQRKDLSRFQDIVVNIGASLIFTLARVFLLTVVIVIFTYLYDNYRIVSLPLHSVWTWLFSLLLVEFVYYWTHRALHEINLLWAAHQFHHMAEDVNISTTIRDSIVDLIIYDIFPLPLAVIIPPPILVVHIQFSLIYQIWLHNEVVGNLGFIEYIINTPRQHRVHHGRNPYCIDKNYGALIMVWDRIFGTHQTEKEKITFGVVSPTPQTYDSMILQFGYYRDLWKKFQSVDGFWNKFYALFKGPGWQPGKPRLGLISDVPEPDPTAPKYSYDPYIPMWKKAYVLIHGTFLILGFFILADHPFIRYSPWKGLVGMLYIIFVLTSFGAIFDNRKWAPHIEIVRCLIYFPFDHYLIASVEWDIGQNERYMLLTNLWVARLFHILSIALWVGVHIRNMCSRSNCNNSRRDNNNEYDLAAMDEKDIESDISSMKKDRCSTFTFFIMLIVLIMSFTFAWATRIDECAEFFNTLKLV